MNQASCRRRLLSATTLFALSIQYVTAQTPLAQQIATLTHEPAVARDHWGVMVTTLDGKPLYALNEAQLFQPASNAKLFTTAAAMRLLGSDRQLTTSLVEEAREPYSKMSLCDLRLRGSGDANFSRQEVPYGGRSNGPQGAAVKVDLSRGLVELADQFVQRIGPAAHVTGDIIGDDTLFSWEPYAPDWAADDLVWGYGAPVSALTIADNQLQLRVVPAWRDGYAADVTLDRAFGFYTLQASVLTVPAKAAASVQIDRALGSRVLRVSGTIAVDSKFFVEDVAIEDPAAYAAVALKTLLEARGIAVDGVARAEHRLPAETVGFLKEAREPLPGLAPGSMTTPLPDKTVYMTHCLLQINQTSPTLIEDVVVTNKESQNLHAELLLRQLGKAYGHDGSIAQGARVVRQFLVDAGLDKDDFIFFDGSGLSGHDLVTPRATAKLLAYAVHQPWFAAWKASLPVGGVDGSLAGRFKEAPLKGHIFAKTGTLGEARALSGYLECASGRTVIFSIMDGNHLPGTNTDRDVMDRIVAAIAAAN